MTITDALGREWKVYDFQVLAGKSIRMPLGRGQYRGFSPVDGGARRTLLMFEKERARPITRETLLDQLARSKIFYRDDPNHITGMPPERVDPK